MNDKLTTVIEKAKAETKRIRDKQKIEAAHPGKPLDSFEYLTHHIEMVNGKEEVHHCYLYDHIANLFEQEHLVIKDGKAYLGKKQIKDGTFHIIKGLEKKQEVAWSDEEAKAAKIKLMKLKAGMTLKQKAKVW